MSVEFDDGVLLERLALHKGVQRCSKNAYAKKAMLQPGVIKALCSLQTTSNDRTQVDIP